MPRNGAKQEPAGFMVEQWPIDRLVGYARNPRKVPEAAIDKLAAGIREFGWRVPVIVDDSGTIIAGHTRVAAARRLGLAEVPVHIARDLTPQQAKAFRLFDNRVVQETTWEHDLTALELRDLHDLAFELELTGFDEAELQHFLEEPTDHPGVRMGSLADLGDIGDPDCEKITITVEIGRGEEFRNQLREIGSTLENEPLYRQNTFAFDQLLTTYATARSR